MTLSINGTTCKTPLETSSISNNDPSEEECQIDTMVEEQCLQQPHQGLIEDFIEMSEGLSKSSYTCAVVFPREKKEEILPFITEEGSETKVVEEPKKNVLQPIST